MDCRLAFRVVARIKGAVDVFASLLVVGDRGSSRLIWPDGRVGRFWIHGDRVRWVKPRLLVRIARGHLHIGSARLLVYERGGASWWHRDGLAGRRRRDGFRSWVPGQTVRSDATEIAGFLRLSGETEGKNNKAGRARTKRSRRGHPNGPFFRERRNLRSVRREARRAVACPLADDEGGEDLGHALVASVPWRIAVTELLRADRGLGAALTASSEPGVVVGPAGRVHQDQAGTSQFGQHLLRQVAEPPYLAGGRLLMGLNRPGR